jgi:hypothetical protein
MVRVAYIALLAALTTAALPAESAAQAVASGTIAGVVRDTSGAVMPGVTVEAASPALIEKTRSAVTDAEGNYKIIDLRPGAYVVTFTLSGFSTLRREGIELSTGFTATVNADMKVGALEETLTVTGASPVVDTQNTRTQNVLSRETLDSLPTGRSYYGYATLTVGASSAVSGGGQDVGGTVGEAYGFFTIHGSSSADGDVNIDGMTINNNIGAGGGSSKQFHLNQVGIQEVVVTTGGGSAEQPYSGVSVNAVPKDGGNRFSYHFFTADTAEALQTNNVKNNESLKSRFVTRASQVKKIWDIGGGVGGPIVKDKLWFYTAHRTWGNAIYVPGAFYPLTSGGPRFVPDRSRRAYTDFFQRDHTGRVTYQANAKHKFTGQVGGQHSCNCNYWIQWGIVEQDATVDYDYLPAVVSQGTWTYTVNNKLLIQAGVSHLYNRLDVRPTADTQPTDISIMELSTGRQFNSYAVHPVPVPAIDIRNYGDNEQLGQHNERLAVSYVTGSHAAKFGFTMSQGRESYANLYVQQSVAYQYFNGVPSTLTQYASPASNDQRMRTMGIFAQDQWTLKRLTANLGVRFDYLNGRVPAQSRPAGIFLGALNFQEVENVPNYKDVSPRLGAAYDLFGNGKTAIKGSFGRYVMSVGTNIARSLNPANALVSATTRTWNDSQFGAGDPRTGNFRPDCDLFNFDTNGECGPINNRAFGTLGATRQWDPDLLEGWGIRQHNWQTSLGIQHELRPGFGIDVSWFRTSFGGLTVTQNTSLTPADFDKYCITGPSSSRLPGGGGAQICGLYDVKPEKFGIVTPQVSKASDFGDWAYVYNGVDAQFKSRFGKGGLLNGGVSISRTVIDSCFATSHPEITVISPAFAGAAGAAGGQAQAQPNTCRIEPPLGAGTQFKLSGLYPLPYDVQVAATFQNLPGTPHAATWVAGNAQISQSLGRNLAACPATGACSATRAIDIIPFQELFEDRITQMDLRLTKVIRLGRARIQGMAEMYNVFNAAAATGVSAAFPAAAPAFWLFPYQIMGGRLFKFGAQFDW